MRRGRSILFAAVLVAAISGHAAWAGKKNDTLVWLTTFEPPTYDFYAQTNREGVVLAKHIWDTLLERDPKSGEVKPHLATSVTFVDSSSGSYSPRIVHARGQTYGAPAVRSAKVISDVSSSDLPAASRSARRSATRLRARSLAPHGVSATRAGSSGCGELVEVSHE